MERICTIGMVALLVLIICTDVLHAQSLTNIPDNVPNTRFGSQDVFGNQIVRPALSVRGFASSTLSGGTNHGLGMKQILEKLLANEFNIEDVINEPGSPNDIVGQADMDLVTPTGTLKDKREDLEKNSRITQSRAFVALATCILEHNGYSDQQIESIFGESPFHALVELKDALLNPPGDNHSTGRAILAKF